MAKMARKSKVSKKSRMSKKSKMSKRHHRGGSGGNTGFTFNQSDIIGGQMARVGYSQCDNPDYFNTHKIYDIPQQQPSSQVGGRRKSRKGSKSRRSKKSRKSSRRHSRK